MFHVKQRIDDGITAIRTAVTVAVAALIVSLIALATVVARARPLVPAVARAR